MLTLAQQIKYNYPQNILSWFGNKPTHIIKVGQAVEGTQKRMCKSLVYAIAAFITLLSEGTLPNFVGHIMNSTHTGYRLFVHETLGQYVSFEILSNGMKRVLEVYEIWKGFQEGFGYNNLGVNGTTVKNRSDVIFRVPAYEALLVMYVTD